MSAPDLFRVYYSRILPLPAPAQLCEPVPRAWRALAAYGVAKPCEAWDALRVFAVSAALVTAAMVALRYAWPLASRSFADIQPRHKRWYVIANVAKASMLAMLALSPTWLVLNYTGYYLGVWDMTPLDVIVVKRSVAAYVVVDVVALFIVPKLPRTTVIHHVVAAVLCLVIVTQDLPNNDLVQKIAMYGSWSTLSWAVNFFLAMRVMYDGERWVDFLAVGALITYVLCCIGNWTWHVCWFIAHLQDGTVTAGMVAYLICICAVIRDDIILMGWLYKRGTRAKSYDLQVGTRASTFTPSPMVKKRGGKKSD